MSLGYLHAVLWPLPSTHHLAPIELTTRIQRTTPTPFEVGAVFTSTRVLATTKYYLQRFDRVFSHTKPDSRFDKTI